MLIEKLNAGNFLSTSNESGMSEIGSKSRILGGG